MGVKRSFTRAELAVAAMSACRELQRLVQRLRKRMYGT